jgi:hypothetical protein
MNNSKTKKTDKGYREVCKEYKMIDTAGSRGTCRTTGGFLWYPTFGAGCILTLPVLVGSRDGQMAHIKSHNQDIV